jgi:hypothetical protein
MRADEVPQDASFLEDHKRGAYAVGEDGRYTLVATKGWSVETAATTVALEVADAGVAQAWHAVRQGKKSPLHYWIAAKLLTPALVATYSGAWRLSVWWHCRPGPFSKVSAERRAAYAKALRISVEQLSALPEKPETLL